MSRINRFIALVLALLMSLPLAACGTADDDKDDYVKGQSAGVDKTAQTVAADDVFTLNCNKSYSMNPLIATNTNNQLVCSLVYENIVEVDNSFEVQPNVVSEWSSEDGSSWTLKVASGHTFHNGAALTATDVAYTIQIAMRNDRFKSRLSCVSGCSASDSETVVVNLSKKNMQFMALLSIPVIQYGTATQTYPGGSGPYQYADDYNSLTAFSKYKSAVTLPLKTIYLKEYSGTEETMSAFADSLIDVVVNDPSATTNIGYGNENDIRAFNTTNMHYIVFNSYSTDFQNAALRFAMNYAFDRDYIVNQLGGYAAEANLPVNPASSLYNENYAKQFNYNLNKVQEMLSSAGMKDYDGDGFLEIQNGDTLVEIDLSFLVYSGSTVKVNAAKKFAEDMKSLGLQVTINKQDWDNYKKVLEAGNYDMCYCEVRLGADFDLSSLLGSGAALNYGSVSDSQLDELISAYLAAGPKDSNTACDNMCAYIANKAYIVPLIFERHQLVSHRGVIEGAKANENNPMCNIENWTVNIQTAEKTEDTGKAGTD